MPPPLLTADETALVALHASWSPFAFGFHLRSRKALCSQAPRHTLYKMIPFSSAPPRAMCEPVTCIALCGASSYGVKAACQPLTDKLMAARIRRRRRREAATLRNIVSSNQPAPPEATVSALWRFAHLLLARAQGSHEAAARATALRLVVCEEVPLDAMRTVAAALHSEVSKRGLVLRVPSWKERALAKLPLPGLVHRGGGDGDGAGSADRRRLAKDTFYALGSLALTSGDGLEAAAAAAASAVLDSPAASAQLGEREVVAESIKRLADAIEEEYQREVSKLEREAGVAAAAAERARARASSGRKLPKNTPPVPAGKPQEVQLTAEVPPVAEKTEVAPVPSAA